jgi:uncharacterized protein (DUF2252 family)
MALVVNASLADTSQLTPTQRAELGRRARSVVPRSDHGRFEPAPNRADPVALLAGQSATRIPELVPIRYGRMASSPFAFFRGAGLIMAADLAGTPVSGLRVQLSGDAHLSNFGLFASPERQLVFDLNDFDETLPGPWEWDLKRLVASLEIVGRENGLAPVNCEAIVTACSAEYRRAMAEFAGMHLLDIWYSQVAVDRLVTELSGELDRETLRRTGRVLAKARTGDHLQVFSKLVSVVDGKPGFVSDPPLLVPVEQLLDPDVAHRLEGLVDDALHGYRRSLVSDRRHLVDGFRFAALARKVVGVGSVGMWAFVALMLGRDGDDQLILQIKQAQPSVLAAFTGRTRFANQGQRVVAGQRLMQASSDIFLGWHRFTDVDGVSRDCYVRQLRDWKGSVEVDQMSAPTMTAYAALCAWTLARAHARSGDPIAIAAYLGSGTVFDRALAQFASSYADQNERDHARLVAAVAQGTIVADERW